MTVSTPPTPATPTSETTGAIVCMLVGAAFLTGNDALIKSLSHNYPLGQLLFVRGAFIWPWIVMIALWQGGLGTLKIKSIKGQFLRACCLIASAFLFVAALRYLPLTDAIAIAFTGPLFITAMAPIVLGEKVGWRRWAAVVVGFIGVLCIVRPGNGALQWAALLPLGAALCGGARDLITRRLSQTETSVALLGVTTGVVMAAGLTTLPFGWVAIEVDDLWAFGMSGMLLAAAHYLMIESFRRGEAALVAPFKYSSLIWALILGFAMFGDLPDTWTLVGATIIIGSGLYVLRRETQLKPTPPISATGPSARL